MSDPQTTARGLYIPARGTNVGTWDLPANADFSATDSMFGNVATIGLTNANVTLTTPPNAGSAWSGPYQSQSAILRFTGTLTGNCIITIGATGFFIVENLCTVGSFYVALASSAPGQIICAPPGEACHIYCDGVNVKYVNLGRVGSYMDLAVSVFQPWIQNCTVKPYLYCDGTVYTATAVYGVGNPTPLLNLLGTTFGGNGITTFGVPDLRGRARIPLDDTAGRVTTAGSGIDGNTINSAGGSQFIQQHTHAWTPTTQSWSTDQSGVPFNAAQQFALPGGNSAFSYTNTPSYGKLTISVTPNGSIGNTGVGNSQNMQPTLVSGLTFIKT